MGTVPNYSTQESTSGTVVLRHIVLRYIVLIPCPVRACTHKSRTLRDGKACYISAWSIEASNQADRHDAAQALKLSLQILEVTSERDFEAVFQAAVSQQDGALIVAPDAFFLTQRVQIADLAIRRNRDASLSFSVAEAFATLAHHRAGAALCITVQHRWWIWEA